jgi:hypothetical protein
MLNSAICVVAVFFIKEELRRLRYKEENEVKALE